MKKNFIFTNINQSIIKLKILGKISYIPLKYVIIANLPLLVIRYHQYSLFSLHIRPKPWTTQILLHPFSTQNRNAERDHFRSILSTSQAHIVTWAVEEVCAPRG